jgi:hypothetical protein
MVKDTQKTLIESYLIARQTVINKGFAPEINWQESRSLSVLSESEFLEEAAWVILNTGMREGIVRRYFPKISIAFLNWVSAEEIVRNRTSCEAEAVKIFNHPRKIDAIGSICEKVAYTGFDIFRENIRVGGVDFLQTLDFIGPITKYHLAKNVGLDVVKPDRHLVRLTEAANFKNPRDLCQTIAEITGDKISVVDVILWRYATLDPQYVALFQPKD